MPIFSLWNANRVAEELSIRGGDDDPCMQDTLTQSYGFLSARGDGMVAVAGNDGSKLIDLEHFSNGTDGLLSAVDEP